ncbi:MAG TPA: YciI family protein [Actinomycetota bacterium]
MRFMMMVKGDSEPGVLPSEEMLAAMAKYNEELMKAGVLLDLSGLRPSAEGVRVKFSGGKRTVIDGPFAESKELLAGYWIIDVKSKAEAIEWAKRVPFTGGGELGDQAEIEIRPFFELDDFGGGPAVERHRELGEELAKRKA